MAGLRERKKAESRQRMLDVAKQLFIERGYSSTTMEDIADQAGFGVATLYNYFRTKEGIFATMAREDMTVLERAGEQALSRLPDDPVDAVYALLQVYNRVYEFISYGLMQDFLVQSKSAGPLHEVSVWVLGWQHNQVVRALGQRQNSGAVSPELDCELAAKIVIDLLVRHNQRVADPSSEEGELGHLRHSTALILKGWVRTD